MKISADIQAGSIFWLPPKDRCANVPDTSADVTLIPTGCYNHPVLIYGVGRNKSQVAALIVQLAALNLILDSPIC